MVFGMFTKKLSICQDGEQRRQSNQANSQFIMKVREEDRRDKILEDVFMRSTEENPYLKQIEASVALCTAIANEKHAQQNKERRRMVRRQTNDDLRQLEYKLRAAYISKAVAAQSFEEQQLAVEEKAKALQENQKLDTARLHYHEYIQLRIAEAQEKKKALKRDLQAQMALKEAERHEEKLEKMKDKEQMDQAVKQYNEELIKNKQAESQQKIRIKKEMDDFEVLQAKWREERSRTDGGERQQYEKLVALREEERRKFLQKQQEIKIQKALKSEEMGKENHKAAEMKRISFDFLTDLLIDEREAKESLKSAKDNERKSRERINFRNDLIYQQKLKEKQRMDEKKHEEELHRDVMRVLEQRDAVQRIMDEKKRKDTEEHRKALLHALNEQKRLRAKEMKRLLMEESSEQANCQRRAREIEKARGRMIKKHAPTLAGFIVPKIISDGSNN